MAAWTMLRDEPVVVVAPKGPSTRFVEPMLDIWVDELDLRRHHSGRTTRPSTEVISFAAPSQPEVVWKRDGVEVSAVAVRHQPVEPAVAYRVDHDGAFVVISGDTLVCDEVEALASGADVLVHEACRVEALAGMPFEFVKTYHADTRLLGGLASRAGVGRLVLTHLLPPAFTADDEAAFERDVRDGGFSGPVNVDPASIGLADAESIGDAEGEVLRDDVARLEEPPHDVSGVG
jgi:ribonuclease Z